MNPELGDRRSSFVGGSHWRGFFAFSPNNAIMVGKQPNSLRSRVDHFGSSWLQPNPSVKQDRPKNYVFTMDDNFYPSGSGFRSVRPSYYFRR